METGGIGEFSEVSKPQMYKVKKICSICGKDMGEMESPINLDSHGYCPECAPKAREKALAAAIKTMEKEKFEKV